MSFTVWSPGVVTTFYGFFDVFGYEALGPRRTLNTDEYHLGGEEMRELRSRKPASWDVQVPEGAQLFSVTSSLAIDFVGQFWVGWLLGPRVHMQALMQEKPIETDLPSNETLIFPAVMDKTGRAALYSWRPAAGGAGTELARRVFSGAIHKPGTIVAETLTAIPGKPTVAGTGIAPEVESQHALVGWVEDAPDGARVGLAVIRPDRMKVFLSEPIADTAAFPRQRLGIWAASLERAEVAAILEQRGVPHSYLVARLSVEPASEKPALTTTPFALPAALHTAAIDYYKDDGDRDFNRTLLTENGDLWRSWSSARPPRLERHGISLDDPLAVVTVVDGVFWGTRAPDGRLVFKRF